MSVVNQAVRFGPNETHPGETLYLRIDRLPLSLNFWTRKFWTKRSQDAANMKMHVVHAFGVRRRQWVHLNGPWFTVPVEMWLTYCVREGGRERNGRFRIGEVDTDNLVPKHIIDALKGLAFADDTARHIPLVSNEVEFIADGDPYTLVTIAPYRKRV